MITPRRTRLVRVRDLHAFRHAIVESIQWADTSVVVVVPTVGAARQLRRTIALRTPTTEATEFTDNRNLPGKLGELGVLGGDRLLQFVTRDELYDRLHAGLSDPPRRLSPYEREALARASAREAVREDEPRELRPGLIAEALRFYDQLRRQRQQVARFEELLEETLQRDAEFDRGAERMLRQTRMLAATFRSYERRVAELSACDEHSLRARLMSEPAAAPVRAAVVTVADWIAEPGGLNGADFDLLARLPGLETIDVVATEGILESGFHQRIHDWLPGIEEISVEAPAPSRPRLSVPAGPAWPEGPTGTADRLWFTSRDREEELIGVARRLKAQSGAKRAAVVYKRPLPYLYVAREVFGSARIPYHTSDTLPLAAEPFAAAVDLVFELVASSFTRDAVVAFLRSPHFAMGGGGGLRRSAVSALDRALSGARYLGELERLSQLAVEWQSSESHTSAWPALAAAIAAAERLSPLRTPAPASLQIERLLSFLQAYAVPERLQDRARRARSAVVGTLEGLAAASRAHDDAPIDVNALASLVRRWIEEQTFAQDPDAGGEGLQLVDDQAARYGDFDEVTIVGLIDGEWPERPQRNIFYSPGLLKALGWPSEKDWRSAAEARFLDLLGSPADQIALSTVTLDDEALVDVSALLDEVPRARLSTFACDPSPAERMFVDEALSIEPVDVDALDPESRVWAGMRIARSHAGDPAFHGQAGAQAARPWAVSALETYLECPFKFFAQRVLRLEEEPDDEEVMDPRRQGQFVHEVFEKFFARWQESGRQAVTPGNLADACAVFEEVVEECLGALPDTEAALERTRLLGSSAAAGLGDAVLRMEAERPAGVIARLLEHKLEGEFTFETGAGPRVVRLKGKADRVDLLEDGTFRLIDYKLGWPPNRARALQLPIYSLCAEQQFTGRLGRNWTLGEAAYVAFKGPKRVVRLFSRGDRERVLKEAQQRLVDAIDGIERGDFPPHPHDVYRCETCAFSAVCRKDYVGDV